MHEAAQIAALIRKIESVAEAQGTRRVVGVTVVLGDDSLSAERLGEHFWIAARGTAADGARLAIKTSGGAASHPGGVVLESVEVEE